MAEEKSMSFGWDDEVEESDFEIMPDGDYVFTVTQFERAWYEAKPEAKISSCHQANIELTISWRNDQGMDRTSKIVYKLKLSRTLQFMIYQFFESIGLRKKGDGTTKMPWDQIIGKTGICQVGHHEDNKGNTYNDIIKCYPVDIAPGVTRNSTTVNTAAPTSPTFNL